MKLPKNILRVRDLTFILPDNFNGTLEDALDEFVKYRKGNIEKSKKVTEVNNISSIEILLTSDDNNIKACGEYGIFQLIDGRYVSIVDDDIKDEQG